MNYQISKSPDIEESTSERNMNLKIIHQVQHNINHNSQSEAILHRYQDLQEENAVRLNRGRNKITSLDAMIQQNINSDGQKLKIFDYENKIEIEHQNKKIGLNLF